LVACVVSKKFIKFLRKSLKKFDLNLKRKWFEKEKKENHSLLTFRPKRPAGPSSLPALAHLSLSLFFLFCGR
jgi:hypothetical protein